MKKLMLVAALGMGLTACVSGSEENKNACSSEFISKYNDVQFARNDFAQTYGSGYSSGTISTSLNNLVEKCEAFFTAYPKASCKASRDGSNLTAQSSDHEQACKAAQGLKAEQLRKAEEVLKTERNRKEIQALRGQSLSIKQVLHFDRAILDKSMIVFKTHYSEAQKATVVKYMAQGHTMCTIKGDLTIDGLDLDQFIIEKSESTTITNSSTLQTDSLVKLTLKANLKNLPNASIPDLENARWTLGCQKNSSIGKQEILESLGNIIDIPLF